MCSFTLRCHGNIELISTLINSELNKSADWLAVNKLSVNVKKLNSWYSTTINGLSWKTIFHASTRVTEFNFLGLTVNEYMNWNSYVRKIANKISRTLDVLNRLNDTCPFQQWNWCMIRWSFRTSNLELQIGASNGTAYQNYKKAPFGLWQIAGTMLTPSRFSNNYICWR